jgi:hypothetical protein
MRRQRPILPYAGDLSQLAVWDAPSRCAIIAAMAGTAKVLNGLMERRALESAFQELGTSKSVEELAVRARAIADHGAGVIPMLVARLDTTDPQMRGGLGQVAARLPREQAVPALRAVARSRERSDQARLTALMILDRFLHEPVDESLLAGLQDPEAVAIQSLQELAHEMERNPFVVIEYLNQLAEQPSEVAGVVLDAIPRLPVDAQLITLLRMFAQGGDEVMAKAALEQLSRNRSPEAAHALAALSLTLPPHLAATAGRGLRKLRLSGTAPVQGPSPTEWRALISPVDGTGAQVVWFVRQPGDGERGTLLSILGKDPDGVVACFGSNEVPFEDLPPAQPLGSTYLIRQTEDAPTIMLLEAPLDLGRAVVRAALELNWAAGEPPPMEYRLLNPLIWELGPVAMEPVPDLETRNPLQTVALLDHPAFANWFWQAPELYDVAEQLGRRHGLPERAAEIGRLAQEHFDAGLLASYGRRLAGMARWLVLAGQEEAAALAAAASRHLAEPGDPAASPLLLRLIGTGLDIAVANLRGGFDLRQHQAATV